MNKTMQKIDAADFKRTNGTVMRTVSSLFSTRFFEVYELETALSMRNIDELEIKESLDYLEGQGYIEVREIETKRPVRLCDFDKEEIEIKLSSEGKLVVLSINQDAGIDM